MKRIVRNIILGVMAMMMILSSCQHDERIDVPENNSVPEGYVEVDFRVNQSDIREVKVRSVDPDGQDINRNCSASIPTVCFWLQPLPN